MATLNSSPKLAIDFGTKLNAERIVHTAKGATNTDVSHHCQRTRRRVTNTIGVVSKEAMPAEMDQTMRVSTAASTPSAVTPPQTSAAIVMAINSWRVLNCKDLRQRFAMNSAEPKLRE